MKTTPLFAAALLALGLATTSCEKEEPLQPSEKADVIVEDPETKDDDGDVEDPAPQTPATPPAPEKNPDAEVGVEDDDSSIGG